MTSVGTVLQVIATTVGITVSLGGLVGLTIQIVRLRRSLQSQVYQGLIANSLKLDELMISNPKLRKYIYDGAPVPPDDMDESELEALIEFVVDVIDNFKAQEGSVPKQARPGWQAFADHVMEQPAVIQFMSKRGHWFSGTLN
ncbi:hypothetical protein [Promicromonospora sp. NPDC023805]|uniref:hypothetical protein n=1 Tax=Promicromonospora sp. NPDC023805 TaxID=3154696 RepID=UPI0033D87F05